MISAILAPCRGDRKREPILALSENTPATRLNFDVHCDAAKKHTLIQRMKV